MVRSTCKILCMISLALLVSSTALSAQTSPSQLVSKTTAAWAATPAPQEVFAPYWTSEPGWETELQLKNNLTTGPLTVTPVLRLSSGQEIPLDPVTIAPKVSVSVWVNEGR
jgi:hypothetical protein